MSEEKVRVLAISETTFSKMTEEMIDHLKKEEHIRLIVVDDSLIHQTKMLMHEKIDGIILSEEEASEYEKELETAKSIFEYQNPISIESMLEKLPEVIYENPEPKQKKSEFYVPRTIGKPNSKKRGGR